MVDIFIMKVLSEMKVRKFVSELEQFVLFIFFSEYPLVIFWVGMNWYRREMQEALYKKGSSEISIPLEMESVRTKIFSPVARTESTMWLRHESVSSMTLSLPGVK